MAPDPDLTAEQEFTALRAVTESPQRSPQDRLTAHIDLGWALAARCLDGYGTVMPDTLDAAVGHLRVALIEGIEGIILRNPVALALLAQLTLLLEETSASADDEERESLVTEALELFDESLGLLDDAIDLAEGSETADREVADLRVAQRQTAEREEIEVRQEVLSGAAAAWRRLAALAAARGDRTTWLEALEAQVSIWDQLFVALPPSHPQAPLATAQLMRAVGERGVVAGVQPDDIATLMALAAVQPFVPLIDGNVEEAEWTALVVAEVLAGEVERTGRDDTLLAAAAILDDARTWPRPRSSLGILLDATLANVIANASDASPLTARLDEADELLRGVLDELPLDHPERGKVVTAQAMVVQRRVGASPGHPTQVTLVAHQLADATAGLGTGTAHTAALGQLGVLMSLRFQKYRDLRDARAATAFLEEALEEFTGTDHQRATMLGNHAALLLRIAVLDGRVELLDRALQAVIEARELPSLEESLAAHLGALHATVLGIRSAVVADSDEAAASRAEAAEVLAASGSSNARALGSALVQALRLTMEATLTPAPANAERFRQVLEELGHLRAGATAMELVAIDTLRAMMVTWSAGRGEASPEEVDRNLLDLRAAAAELSPLDPMWAIAAMREAELLRARDNRSWAAAVAAETARPVLDDVSASDLRHWLNAGGSDVSAIGDLVASRAVIGVRDRPDRTRARDLGLAALRTHAARVLLQTGTRDAIVTAHAASSDAHRVATWCLADGAREDAVTALETGRAMTLWAAGVDGAVPARLEALGEAGLAQDWKAHPRGGSARATAHAVSGEPSAGPRTVPDDVRYRAVQRLFEAGDFAALVGAPDAARIGAVLRMLRYDALVYLLPSGLSVPVGDDDRLRALLSGGQQENRGGALVVTDGGGVRWVDLPELTVGPSSAVERYLQAHRLAVGGALPTAYGDPLPASPHDAAAWQGRVEELCAWAWKAGIGPLERTITGLHPVRRPRIVLVPADTLTVVPWHAAFPPSDLGSPPQRRRHALSLAVISYAASAGLLARIQAIPSRALEERVLIVGDQADGLEFARLETRVLRQTYYPNAEVWGGPPSESHGPATPARLREALAGGRRSLFHFAGHAVVYADNPGASALLLGDQRLRADDVSRLAGGPGFLACLAACTTHVTTKAFDEAFTLSTAFLLGGASSVVGSLWRLDDAATTVLMFMLHHHLRAGLRPGDALHRVQQWMLNPDRRTPSTMPAEMRDGLAALDLTNPVMWAGLIHQGW